MLGLLFDFNFWIWIAVIVLILVWLKCCNKYESFKVATLGLLAIALVGFTGYSAVNLGVYYNAQGGIYGVMEDTSTSDVKIDGMSFEFSNLNLTQVLDSNVYSLEIVKEPLKIDVDSTYGVFVNGSLATNNSVSSKFVIAEYRYLFKNIDGELLCDDSLDLRFYFNANNTKLVVKTENPEAVKYWHSYFNNNGFVVTLEPINYIPDWSMSECEGVIPAISKDNIFLKNVVETSAGESVDMVYLSSKVLCAMSDTYLYRFDFDAIDDTSDIELLINAISTSTMTKYVNPTYAYSDIASIDKGINHNANHLKEETGLTLVKMFVKGVNNGGVYVATEMSVCEDISGNIVIVERVGDEVTRSSNGVLPSQVYCTSIFESYQAENTSVNRVNNPYVVYAQNIF